MNLLEKTIEAIRPADDVTKAEAQKRQDSLVKPIGSLGKLEDIAVKIAGMTGKVKNRISKKCVVIMSSDNGIWEEGVSQCPQNVTAIQTVNFLKGLTGICVLSRHAGADIKVVDIGINADMNYPGLISRKIRKGTSNMSKGPAMTREEAIKGIETGIEMIDELVKEGYDLFGTGEMGICNTSTSSAMLMAFTGCSSDAAVGKGIGITEQDYNLKKRTIEKAVTVNAPDKNDAIDVLAKLGGFDIAGMAGCFLGAAKHRIPIVIDGFISAVAALTAYKLCPVAIDYMIPSHCSAEPGYILTMKEIGMDPILNLGMRLGEGTGCPLAFNIIEASLAVMDEMATFEEASINDDFIVDIR